jgi:hypothetical protein
LDARGIRFRPFSGAASPDTAPRSEAR